MRRDVTRLSVDLDREKAHELKTAAVESRMTSSDWVRSAIDAKLGTTAEDARLSRIESAYSRMNEDGRAWLEKCAEIAATAGSAKI